MVRDGESIGALLTRMGAQDTRLTWEERRSERNPCMIERAMNPKTKHQAVVPTIPEATRVLGSSTCSPNSATARVDCGRCASNAGRRRCFRGPTVLTHLLFRRNAAATVSRNSYWRGKGRYVRR